jgi:MscS family membrane protein
MPAPRHRFLLPASLALALGTLSPAPHAPAAPPSAALRRAAQAITVRPPAEFLTSPRDTLRALYYAVVAYDLQPKLIAEAVACLDLDPGVSPAEAARLAIDLEQVLRTLCVPILGVPKNPPGKTAVVFNGEGFDVRVARGPDGLWRFDRDTVARIPAMQRLALARFRNLQAERAGLRDGYTDPSATMRRFLTHMVAGNFYYAARCLDLNDLPVEDRADQGPVLARQLAVVIQRRGWIFMQEVPNQPSGPPFTWSADRFGRVALERVRGADGKDAWLFSSKTVRNLPAMYEQARALPADPRYARLGVALPPLTDAEASGAGRRAPPGVPPSLASPRAMLQGFFRVMDAAETRDARLPDALPFLDLRNIPPADVPAQGPKIACQLEGVLRKIHIDLASLPDDWNAPLQVLGESQGVRVEIVRLRDGCWRFSPNTVRQAPAFFERLTAADKADPNRAARLDSARDAMSTFLRTMRRGEYDQAADCLDLAYLRTAAQEAVGPVLAYKLKYVIDRIGRVYIQEVPDAAEGPRYVFYRGELGRIVLARKADGPRKGSWLFTAETVRVIEPMFRSVLHQPAAVRDDALAAPTFWRAPGLWVRFRVPDALRVVAWKFQLYQWLGLALAALVCVLVPRLVLAELHRLVALVLRKSGSELTRPFVAARLRPLTWVTAWWLLFQVLALLDLPVRYVDALLPLKTFGLAGLFGLVGLRLVDLAMAVYTNSELLRPHRSLGDMVVPVSMRSLKGLILLLVTVYVVYQIGEGESLSRFLTGLGVAGLAASLAAQDALKSFFSTLLLIGERSFRLGDRIVVGELEGVVEQVGFRATRLRTAGGSLLTIPNSTITSAPIDNRGSKVVVHCKASLLVPYAGSPQALEERLAVWLHEHPGVRTDRATVGVRPLAGGHVEVELDVTASETYPGDEREFKEELHREVLRLCAGAGVAAAA